MTPTAADREKAQEIVGVMTFGPGVEDAVVDSINEVLETIRDRIVEAISADRTSRLRLAKELVTISGVFQGYDSAIMREARRIVAGEGE